MIFLVICWVALKNRVWRGFTFRVNHREYVLQRWKIAFIAYLENRSKSHCDLSKVAHNFVFDLFCFNNGDFQMSWAVISKDP